ncbi:hypothetical protein D3C71_1474470 [compost metagenome]
MIKKATAPGAEAGAAAPAAAITTPVHTSAPAKPTKPAHHQPTAPRPRDEFTGQGGTYQRDPATGVRTKVPPPAPAEGDGTAAA